MFRLLGGLFMEYQAALNAAIGGGLIGFGAAQMHLYNGKIAGISGITKGLLPIHESTLALTGR
jgi:hypothetical protein